MVGIIILAAGSSSRLGKPKQNLVYKGQTLLQRTVDAAIATSCQPIIIVLGANPEVIRPTIENKSITIIENTEWQEGMASSIRAGIREVQHSASKVSAAILMLCDQPHLDTALLKSLIANANNSEIVTCTYNNTFGAPVLFNANYFDELSLLKGQEGAKKLLLKYADKVASIPFPLGGIDIDTIEDYNKLQ